MAASKTLLGENLRYITLNNGLKIPIIGLGTWDAKVELLPNALFQAMYLRYRHFDCASIYNNEKQVGDGLKRAMDEQLIDREELFITSKVWNNIKTYDDTITAFNKSLSDLGLDYLDLYLIHWPNPLPIRGRFKERNYEVWRALEALYEEGRVKAIGVSNFESTHLEILLKEAKVIPAVNQIEIHPYNTEEKLVDFCRELGIQIESYSPLMRGGLDGPLNDPLILELGKKYHKSPSQIILNWHIEQDFIPLPKATSPSHIRENMDIFSFNLTRDEVDEISNLNKDFRAVPKADDAPF